MKKIIIFLILIICTIGTYFLFIYHKSYPDSSLINEMDVMKSKTIKMSGFEGVYVEKDKHKISIISKALRKKHSEHNVERKGTYDYAIDMLVKDKKDGVFKSYRYAIWIDKNDVFVTMSSFSDKSYKLDPDNAKIIRDFLNNTHFKQ